MGRPALTEEQLRAMRIKTILAAREIIEEEGLAGVSIRSLGNRMGMSSAALYRYFKDIEEVILFTCVHELQEYVRELNRAKRQIAADDDRETYLLSWEVFCKHAFRHPEEYLTIFFSRHSEELARVIGEYYKLFPDETKDSPGKLREMFRTADLRLRNLVVLRPLLEERDEAIRRGEADGRLYGEENIRTLNDMMVAYFYALLLECVESEEVVDPQAQTEKMLRACRWGIEG